MLNVDYIIDNAREVIEKLKFKDFDLDIEGDKKNALNLEKNNQNKKKDLASQKNQISDKFKNVKTDKDKNELRIESQNIEKLISENKEKLESVESQLKILLQIPKIPDQSIPVGDQSKNQILKSWGSPVDNNIDHSEFFEKSLMIDSEAGVNLAKSRFTVIEVT